MSQESPYSLWFGRILAIILLLLGCYFFLRSSAEAREEWNPKHRREGVPTIEECVEKIEFHRQEAMRIFEEVKDRVWWMPNLTDREKARRMFNSIIPAILAQGGVTGKIAAVGLTLFGQYGIDCMDEYDWIENKWYWCTYHAEMADFYESCLIHAARLLNPDIGI